MSTRYSRQSHSCPYEAVQNCTALVVGVGAIGRQVVRQLGLLGLKSIVIVDHDIIEEHNCVPQMFPQSSIGKKKVGYLAEELADLCPDLDLVALDAKWSPKINDHFTLVVPSVDNIDVRKNIFEFYQEKCQAFMDARIGGNNGMVLSATGNYEEKEWYKKTIFPKSEASRNGCAQPMTNYLANIISGLLVQGFANFASGRGLVPKIQEYSGVERSLVEHSEDIFDD